MKTLQALAVVQPLSDTSILQQIITGYEGIIIQFETDIENAIDKINQKEFDLLILDKSLPTADFKKLVRLTELIHTDAAITEFIMTDEAFIRFKISGLWSKWLDAQSDSKTNFLDDPAL